MAKANEQATAATKIPRIELWLFGAGIGVCVGTHVSQLTWWTVVKLIFFWPFAMGYEMTSFLLARGW